MSDVPSLKEEDVLVRAAMLHEGHVRYVGMDYSATNCEVEPDASMWVETTEDIPLLSLNDKHEYWPPGKVYANAPQLTEKAIRFQQILMRHHSLSKGNYRQILARYLLSCINDLAPTDEEGSFGTLWLDLVTMTVCISGNERIIQHKAFSWQGSADAPRMLIGSITAIGPSFDEMLLTALGGPR